MLSVNKIFSFLFFILLLQIQVNADIGNTKWLNYVDFKSGSSNPNSPFYFPQKPPDIFQNGKDTISPPPGKITSIKKDTLNKESQKQIEDAKNGQKEVYGEKDFSNLIIGRWKINIGGIVGSRDEKHFFYSGTLTIKKDGNNLSATLDLGLGTENLEGISFDGKNIKFIRETLVSVQTYKGKVDGKKITGTFIHEDQKQKVTQYWEAERF